MTTAISLSATDADGDPLTWIIVNPPTHGTLNDSAPTLFYTPDLNYNGSDSFTFKVNDGTIDSNTATVSILVNPINDAPVAHTQLITTSKDVAKSFTLIATDFDGNPLTWTIVTTPTYGTLTGLAPSLTYTPDSNYIGSDSITFKVNDGTIDSNIAILIINIRSVALDKRIHLPLIGFYKR